METSRMVCVRSRRSAFIAPPLSVAARNVSRRREVVRVGSASRPRAPERCASSGGKARIVARRTAEHSPDDDKKNISDLTSLDAFRSRPAASVPIAEDGKKIVDRSSQDSVSDLASPVLATSQTGHDVRIPLVAPSAPPAGPTLVDGAVLCPRVLAGEFMATFLFVLLSVASTDSGMSSAGIGAANGAIVAAIAAAFMPVSGAHLNPAVTAALAVTNRVPLLRAVVFVPLQLLAAVLATYLVAASGGTIVANFAAMQLSGAAPLLAQALWTECVPMFIVVVVVFQTAVATPAEGGVGMQLSALYIGLTVFACACTFPGAFNPARAFGPAVYLSSWSGHWIFWMAVPTAMVAALICEHVFIAPTLGRPPNSWLASISNRLATLSHRLRTMGTAGLIAYGTTNVCYYLPVLAFAWIRAGGLAAGIGGLVTAWGIAWAGSQVTKPLRLLISLGVAPYIDAKLRKRNSVH